MSLEKGAEAKKKLSLLSAPPGLCAECKHLWLAVSVRSAFVRCGLAEEDSRFLRYPPLPVRVCEGFARGEE
ncbi:MAG TPA: hypothetical protein VGS22_20015 [Thermoanaerobaculia bacterium]|jgi:hypothetical protein|nr:hypothetical protein [Thermoanaerobaculia bacterium]